MELVTAARRHLASQDQVKILFGDWIWKWKLEDKVEGTGRMAIVLRNGGQWSKPTHNSQEYPILVVEVYADHSRMPDGTYPIANGEDRCMQGVREVDRVLHQVDREHRHWPEGDTDGLYVIGCFRGSEPETPVIRHGVPVVRVTYDVQVIH